MRDLSFVIPLRIDSDDRLRNLEIALRFISRFFPASEVIVVESSVSPRASGVCAANPAVRFRFHEDYGPFSRGATSNIGLSQVTRRFVAIYDADVLLDPRAISRAVRLMRTGIVKAVLPFNWIFADISGSLARRVGADLDFGVLGRIRSIGRAPHVPGLDVRIVKGGVLIADRDVLRLEGGFNKNMVSYGWEDVEIIHRLNKLGYHVYSLRAFSCVHLDHARGPDSVGNEYYEPNEAEFKKVMAMSRPALERYVETDLFVAEPADRRARRALRHRQRIVNAVTLQALAFRLNQVAVGTQVYGLRRLVELAVTRARRRLS